MNVPLRLSAADASGAFPMDPFASAYTIPFLSPELNVYFLSDTIPSIYIQFLVIYIDICNRNLVTHYCLLGLVGA